MNVFVFEPVDFLNYVLNQVDWNVYEHTNLQHTHTEINVYPSMSGFVTVSASAICRNQYGSTWSVGMDKAIELPEQYLTLLPTLLAGGDYNMTIEA